jgi:hypothetical protein
MLKAWCIPSVGIVSDGIASRDDRIEISTSLLRRMVLDLSPALLYKSLAIANQPNHSGNEICEWRTFSITNLRAIARNVWLIGV